MRALESRHHFRAFIFLQEAKQDDKPRQMSVHWWRLGWMLTHPRKMYQRWSLKDRKGRYPRDLCLRVSPAYTWAHHPSLGVGAVHSASSQYETGVGQEYSIWQSSKAEVTCPDGHGAYRGNWGTARSQWTSIETQSRETIMMVSAKEGCNESHRNDSLANSRSTVDSWTWIELRNKQISCWNTQWEASFKL
jgi:hypothetical protein